MEIFSVDFARVFNFILIVLTIAFLFWKYILPNIHSIILEKEISEKKTQNKQQSLEELLSVLNNDFYQEQLLHKHLEQKIIAWKTINEQKNTENIKNIESLQNISQERAFKQTEGRIINSIQEKEILNVVSKLIADIEIKFQEKEFGQLFEKAVITKIASHTTTNRL